MTPFLGGEFLIAILNCQCVYLHGAHPQAPIRAFTYCEFEVREIDSGKTRAHRNRLRRMCGQTISRAAAQNNLVHSERFRMYNVLIWVVKTEIVGIAPTLGRPRKTKYCSVQEDGGVL